MNKSNVVFWHVRCHTKKHLRWQHQTLTTDRYHPGKATDKKTQETWRPRAKHTPTTVPRARFAIITNTWRRPGGNHEVHRLRNHLWIIIITHIMNNNILTLVCDNGRTVFFFPSRNLASAGDRRRPVTRLRRDDDDDDSHSCPIGIEMWWRGGGAGGIIDKKKKVKQKKFFVKTKRKI